MAKKKKFKLPRIFDEPLTFAIRSAMSLPLIAGVDASVRTAGELGRSFATSFINRKRIGRAHEHLAEAFPEIDKDARYELAIQSYEHLFKLGTELCFAPRLLTEDGWTKHILLGDCGDAMRPMLAKEPAVLITGHVGNWELVGYSMALLGFPVNAVYRPLDNKSLDAWLRETRARRGLQLVSKFGAMRKLPAGLIEGVAAGMVADQNGGDRGVFVPFFGRLCSTYKSIGLLALAHNSPLVCGYARRLRRGDPLPTNGLVFNRDFGGPNSLRYAVEIVDIFGPKDWEQYPDPLFYLSARFRRAIETMIRKSPEQYLWMHRVWRARAAHERLDKPFPDALKEKLSWLPWMTSDELEKIIERSERDRLACAKGRVAG
jgi:KDO2-lipid IV(A) lauroyltransferase